MIETELSREQADGNGVTLAFPFAFPILDADELQVILTDTDGVDTTLVRDTHYSVAFDAEAGTVTMFTAPALGETLTILRDMEFTQPTDLVSQSGLDATVLEQALDRIVMQVLQLREQLRRAAKVPASSDIVDFDLPSPEDGKVLGWSGGVLANLIFGTTALTVSSFIETLLDDVDAAAARATLGENASGSFFTLKHNFSAAAAPTANDDVGDGYAVGSFWFDTTGDAVYACIDATLGAAVWRTMTTERGPQFKNRVINGDVRIDQRNAGAAVTVNNTTTSFGPDLWRASGAAADGVFTMARSTASPPPGYSHFLRATVTTADASIGATQNYSVRTPFEGLNMADLGFGAAGAKTVTVSFWVRSSLTGTFSGSLRNAANNRSYAFSFTINAANTWEQKSVTIAGDTSGTWPTDSTAWGVLYFDLGAGTSCRKAAGSWDGTADIFGVTGAVSLISTLAATFDLTGVQLEVGSAATDFERPDFVTQLGRCQRYFQKSYELEVAPGTVSSAGYSGMATNASGDAYAPIAFVPRMRASPTVTLYNHATGATGTWQDGGASNRAVTATAAGQRGFTATCTVAAADSGIGGHWTASAEV